MDHIPVKKTSLEFQKFEHLKSLPLKTEIQNIDILIGQDNSEALVPLQVIQGNKGEPFGVKTILGWSLHGKLDEGATGSLTCGLITSKKVVNHFVQRSIVHSSTSVSNLIQKLVVNLNHLRL